MLRNPISAFVQKVKLGSINREADDLRRQNQKLKKMKARVDSSNGDPAETAAYNHAQSKFNKTAEKAKRRMSK